MFGEVEKLKMVEIGWRIIWRNVMESPKMGEFANALEVPRRALNSL